MAPAGPPDPRKDYVPPVSELLTYGDPRKLHPWPDYPAELGLTAEQVPDLVRMATDYRLATDTPEDGVAWAGSVHAWRALGQLRAVEAVAPLLEAMAPLDADRDDWYLSEFPHVFGAVGPAAIPLLKAYLADTHHPEFPRVCAADGLGKIGQEHPASRARCVDVLQRQLMLAERNGKTVNGFLISYLIDLRGVEAGVEIKRAYALGLVDRFISGDWNDVRHELGIGWLESDGDTSPLSAAQPVGEADLAPGPPEPRPIDPLSARALGFDVGGDPAGLVGPEADVSLHRRTPRRPAARADGRRKQKRKRAGKSRARNRKRK